MAKVRSAFKKLRRRIEHLSRAKWVGVVFVVVPVVVAIGAIAAFGKVTLIARVGFFIGAVTEALRLLGSWLVRHPQESRGAALATIGLADVSPFYDYTSDDAALVRVMVVNSSDQTGSYSAKASWLYNGRPINDAWEVCWARTADEHVRLGGGEGRELNLVVVDHRGFAKAVIPSWNERMMELHIFKKLLSENVGELGVRVWTEGVDGFSACGIRIVDRGSNRDPIVTFDDSILPEAWQAHHTTES